MFDAPRFENAPGIVVRKRLDGTFNAFWQARSEHVHRGFRPKMMPLWRGTEPSDADRAWISDRCNEYQTDMLVFGRGGLPLEQQAAIKLYDGTIRTLVECYKADEDSPYQKLRFRSRETYGHFLKRIVEDHGDKRVKDIDAREVLRWYKDWSKRGVAMAHGLIGHVRSALTYGATLLKCKDCRELKIVLADMRFAQAKPRDAALTADMAIAIRKAAHDAGLPSMALAQAIQFDCMLRQKDVIGEWVPIDEPGLSETHHSGMKWLRGITWEEIDENLLLRHTTSKRQKDIEIRLSDAPMVMEELAKIERKAKGPVIEYEATGRPYSTPQYRQTWRKLANACGIPKNIRNQDSRAGAITEASEAGIPLEHIKHAATHSDIQMTARYSRNAADKTAEVLKLRVAHRNKSGT